VGPLLQHPCPLPDRQPRPWSLLDKPLEDTLGLSEAVSSKQRFFDALPIPAPLLDLVEAAPIGVERVVGFFVGQSSSASEYLLHPRNASVYVVSRSIPLAWAGLAEADAI